MLGADVRDRVWLDAIPGGTDAIVVMEGVSMYLWREELLELLSSMAERFGRVALLMDCYTVFAAKASKYKNPVNEVGVTQLYGVDDPRELEQGNGLVFRREHELTPAELIGELPGGDRAFLNLLFADGAAKKIYRLFEFGTA